MLEGSPHLPRGEAPQTQVQNYEDYEDYEDYEIERIVDHDFKFGTQWYKVAWKGWSEVYDSTWEPRSDLMKNAAKAVLKYEKENDISEEKPDRRKPKKRR